MAWARSRLFSEKFCKDLAKQLSKDEIEDEDADTLCDCQFTLAYDPSVRHSHERSYSVMTQDTFF